MKNKKANIVAVLVSLLFVGCSTTKYIPEGDQLYVGLDKIKYVAQQRDDHFMATRDELEAALACAPNGALLGSSYYRFFNLCKPIRKMGCEIVWQTTRADELGQSCATCISGAVGASIAWLLSGDRTI